MNFQPDNIILQECAQGYEAAPKIGAKLKGILILLHGYGASGDNLISLAPMLSEELNDYYFFAPNAIDKHDYGGGYQWFEIRDTENLYSWDEGLTYCQNKAAALIRQKIQEITQKYTIDQNCPISIFGFSQGAMLALRLVCNSVLPEVKKVVAFSGAFVNSKDTRQLNTDAKVLLLHGKEDGVIEHTYSLKAKQELNSLGFKSVECAIFNNLGHAINYEGLKLAAKFIAQD